MAMTLRLAPDVETMLREISDYDARNMTDEIITLVRERHEQIAATNDRQQMRQALRAAFASIEREDAVALDLLSR